MESQGNPPPGRRRKGTDKPNQDLSFREQALRIINMSLEDAKTQHPLDVPGMFHYERPTLGGTVPIELYRAVRLLSFRELLGSKLAAAMLNLAGQTVADKMGINGLKDSVQALHDLSIARATLDEHADGRIVLLAVECASCSGVPNIGEAVCHFEAGLLAGGLRAEFDGKAVRVVETQCWGLGDQICRWEATAAANGSVAEAALEPMDLIATMAGKAALALDSAVVIKEANRQLRLAYRQLRESERVMKDLTNMVVHDLRVPLTAVIGSVQALAETTESKLDPRETEILGLALAGGETLLQMINDLLDVSKLEERRVVLRKSPTSVGELVAHACGQVQILARRKKLILKAGVPSKLPELPVDRERVIRVLVNLLANAIRHTAPGGKITVSAESVGGEVLVHVEDTGEGIPPDYHDRIFDKFAQVENHKSRRSYSTGLGLAFCKLAIEAHGGRIWVESEPGKGSTFTFALPVG